MKKSIFILFLIFISILLVSCSGTKQEQNSVSLPKDTQSKLDNETIFSVKFIVSDYPETPNGNAIYIMGDFNNWIPGDEEYRLNKNNFDEWVITLEMPKNKIINYQFNAGTYNTIEKDFFGDEITPRSYKFNYNGDSVSHEIENW